MALRQRQINQTAFAQGLSVQEMDATCRAAEEMEQLWRYVAGRLPSPRPSAPRLSVLPPYFIRATPPSPFFAQG